jgi:TerC family integral membrane protein
MLLSSLVLGLVAPFFFPCATVHAFAPRVPASRGLACASKRHHPGGWSSKVLHSRHFLETSVCSRRPEHPTKLHVKASGVEDAEESSAGSVRGALINTALATSVGLAFGAGVAALKGVDSGIEYLAGYVVELSLSVDNLFVFLLLFDFFKVPAEYQPRVLSWGILGAVVMRGIFIALGEVAISKFEPALLVFAGILIFSSVKLLLEDEEEDGDDLSDNFIVQYSNRLLKASDEYDGDRFFTVIDGIKRATPLLLVLVCVELTDILFAVDSIPAVFGITTDPFIVYTSNIFAILNLRALFTVLSTAMGNLPYLRPAVAAVLGFVGAKLGAEYFGYDLSPALSLLVIGSLLGSGVGLSLVARGEETDREGTP